MDRRKFIKTSLCAGCGAALALGCKKNFLPNCDNRKFIYKSKADLPKSIRLEACTLCQLSCPRCGRMDFERFKNGVGLGYLKFKDFKKFVDEYHFDLIELSNYGEIFLNPELDKIIKYSYEKGINLTAGTGVNLNTLSDEMAEILVKYQFRNLVVSIDGATPETYAIYRRGGDFNKVIENIKKINHYKELYNSEYPELVYKFILFGHNEHEIEKVKELAKSLNMKMAFDKNYAADYSPLKNENLVKTLIEGNYPYEEAKLECSPCNQLFNMPQINFNGDLLGCCVPYAKVHYGNVFKDGLLKALNDDNYVYAKQMLTDFSVEPKDSVYCSFCHLYVNQKKRNKPFVI